MSGNDNAENQARAQLLSIIDLVQALDDDADDNAAREAIQGNALAVDVRSGWASTQEQMEPEEFRILLCTGGPAVQIVGDLDLFKEVHATPRLQYQDWFTPWKTLEGLTDDEQTALTRYCQCHYFGD